MPNFAVVKKPGGNARAVERYLAECSLKVDRALEECLRLAHGAPPALVEAIRYAVLSGGKRVRPALMLASCRTVGGGERKVMGAACAVEFIHSYSLVHDDLPSMDDAAERRGQSSCHVKFGEATALLAGDALLTLAFRTLAVPRGRESAADLKRQLEVIAMIAEAAGARGMVGGQVSDLTEKGRDLDLATVESINIRKSGALIAVSCRAGAHLGGGKPSEVEALYRYGKCVGLLFQIVDDILDGEGYSKVLGVSAARREAEALLGRARRELRPFGTRARLLEALAEYLTARNS